MNLQQRSDRKKLTLLIATGLLLAITAVVSAQTLGTTETVTTPTAFWRGEYFNNTDLSGTPALVRPEPSINYNWGSESPAPPVIATDRFSVRWTRILNLAAGQYQFTAMTDDGVRLWVNHQPLIDQWTVHQAQPLTATIDLPGGDTLVKLEYFEDTGAATAHLAWAPVGTSTQPSTTNPVTGIITGTQTLNVRSGPGTGFSPMTTLTSGQLVSLAGRNTDASWLQLRLADDKIGWISALYVMPNLTVAALPITDQVQPVVTGLAATASVTGTQVLNVRSSPDPAATSSTTLAAGQTVLLQGRNTDGTWLQVRLLGGQLGWVSALYLQPTVAVATLPVASATPPVDVGGETIGIVVDAGILNVRNGPGTSFNQLTTLADGQGVDLEGRNADATWLLIRLANGKLGWVSSSYLIPNLLSTDLPVVQ